MKTKLRFIIAVMGITVASLTSSISTAQRDKENEGGCSGSRGECGKTDDGKIIVGVYNT
ncbi:hypothetical protein [Flavobacterium sp. HBTb2-11-1]|uniref:hypothetical protein n=1 Tax=Flavobacterium sp. HBTb2-11-1 TaxID=2692212 RepID=UPI00136B52DA|nr:hypothetical protein [Flavobacterium sp. HBTb2-11-1]MXO06458.1 hypothetical protein [Flavobacterium sp. HBTb2-11-1]